MWCDEVEDVDMQAMTEVFVCDLSLVRAMYEDVEGDMVKFMASTEK